MDSEIKITTPADPKKLAAYRASRPLHKPDRPKLDRMGRRKPQRTGMTEAKATAILDIRYSAHLRYISRED